MTYFFCVRHLLCPSDYVGQFQGLRQRDGRRSTALTLFSYPNNANEEVRRLARRMEDFLNYWDNVLAFWVENGSPPEEESHWAFGDRGLFKELMPGPYLGDPHNCSVVILNYNPGCAPYNLSNEKDQKDYKNDPEHHSQLSNPESMCYHYARNYRERAAAGGYLGRGVDPLYDSSGLTQGGKCWWCKRLEWFKELIPESKKLPFALELCAWHSHKWEGMKYDNNLLIALKDRLAPVIEESIHVSDLGIGLCVGAQWSWNILPAFGYKDVTAEVMDLKDYKRGWKPLNGKRNYCIMRNGNGTYIINTWLSKSFSPMDVPAKEYRPIEKEIIERIRNTKNNLNKRL